MSLTFRVATSKATYQSAEPACTEPNCDAQAKAQGVSARHGIAHTLAVVPAGVGALSHQRPDDFASDTWPDPGCLHPGRLARSRC